MSRYKKGKNGNEMVNDPQYIYLLKNVLFKSWLIICLTGWYLNNKILEICMYS